MTVQCVIPVLNCHYLTLGKSGHWLEALAEYML